MITGRVTSGFGGRWGEFGPGPGFGAFAGANSANFGATGNFDDVLSQILTTTPGQSYTISFELALASTDSQNDFSVFFGGNQLYSLTNGSSFGYQLLSFTSTATSASFTGPRRTVVRSTATRVGLTISYMESEVALDVRDDGVGFDPAMAERGFGLVAMRQRIAALSGTLQVESEPGGGTAVSACVPTVSALASS